MTSRTVVVDNVSPTATEEHLVDFFAFCGTVEHVELGKALGDPPEGRQATVTFTEESALDTALLLSDAIIVDSAVTVRAADEAGATGADATGQRAAAAAGDGPGAGGCAYQFGWVVGTFTSLCEGLPGGVMERIRGGNKAEGVTGTTETGQKTASEVVAGIILAGYFKGDQVIREVRKRAKEFDDQHQIVAGTQTVTDWAKKQGEQLDDQYRLQQKASLGMFALQKALAAGGEAITRGATVVRNAVPKAAPAGQQPATTTPPTPTESTPQPVTTPSLPPPEDLPVATGPAERRVPATMAVAEEGSPAAAPGGADKEA